MITRALSTIYHRMFGSRALRPYESICIEAWRQNLSKDCIKILDWQLGKYDLVQRMSDDKLVCFYRIGDSRCASFPAEYLFAANESEIPPASIYLLSKGTKNMKPMKVDIVIVSGRFFGLELSVPPGQYFSGLGWHKTETEVCEVKVWRDLTVAQEKPLSLRPQRPVLNGWPSDLLSDSFGVPLGSEFGLNKSDILLGSVDAKLPSDYLAFIAHAGGALVLGWTIFGLNEIRKIVYPKDNYYILAEREGKAALAVKEGANDVEIYLLDIEGNELLKLGGSLKTAIESQNTLE
jgi:hypothetical protein